MPTKVEAPDRFRRDLRRIAQKFKSVIGEVENLVTELENDQRPGDQIPNVGYVVYKVRLRNLTAKRGKSESGGFRVIYYVHLDDLVILITIYSKTEQEDISPGQIRQIILEVAPDSTDHDESEPED